MANIQADDVLALYRELTDKVRVYNEAYENAEPIISDYEYDMLLKELNTNVIANQVIKKNYGKSIDEIYGLIETEYANHLSIYWFPGEPILLYPKIKEVKASKPYTSLSGACIFKNSLYINYHALLINLKNESKYVLRKPLIFELGDDIPINLESLEKLDLEYGFQLRQVK